MKLLMICIGLAACVSVWSGNGKTPIPTIASSDAGAAYTSLYF